MQISRSRRTGSRGRCNSPGLEFMLPLLREHGVRFVQLARNGHLAADGITVLDDSRCPERLFARGAWTLWDEMESVGTVPQQAGTRKCSLRATGDVGDRWITAVMGGRPFRQIIGFNADEPGRCLTDQANSKLPGRTGEFPLVDWGWGRQACEDYLLERFGVHWPKSYCTFCFMWNRAPRVGDRIDSTGYSERRRYSSEGQPASASPVGHMTGSSSSPNR